MNNADNRAQVLVLNKRWFKMEIGCSQCGEVFGTLSCDGTNETTFTKDTTYSPQTIATHARNQKHDAVAQAILNHHCFQ